MLVWLFCKLLSPPVHPIGLVLIPAPASFHRFSSQSLMGTSWGGHNLLWASPFPWQTVLGCLRKLAKHGAGNRAASSIHPWLLLQVPLEFLTWLPIMMDYDPDMYTQSIFPFSSHSLPAYVPLTPFSTNLHSWQQSSRVLFLLPLLACVPFRFWLTAVPAGVRQCLVVLICIPDDEVFLLLWKNQNVISS